VLDDVGVPQRLQDPALHITASGASASRDDAKRVCVVLRPSLRRTEGQGIRGDLLVSRISLFRGALADVHILDHEILAGLFASDLERKRGCKKPERVRERVLLSGVAAWR
jgi:hypothetical protein